MSYVPIYGRMHFCFAMTVEFHTDRWFRSQPVAGEYDPAGIDAEQGILHDVVMVQEGPAKGHGVYLEAEFVSDIIAYDQRHFKTAGLKARFGHPSASSETMGTQMGVFKNFRTREQNGLLQGIADLHLLDAADQSPTHPGMRSWMLQMAQERPDFVMSSIVFQFSNYYQRTPAGKKHRLEISNDPWEGQSFTNYKEEWGNVYVEFGSDGRHFYTDLVESGAATESLFGTQANPHFFVSKAHEWLDEHPDILEFVKNNPTAFHRFLKRLGISQPEPRSNMAFNIIKWLSGEPQEATPQLEDLEELRTQLSSVKEAFAQKVAEKEALDSRVELLTAQVDAFQANVEALKNEVEQLKADLATKTAEIEKLKATPAADHTGGPSGAYQRDPVVSNPKTQELYKKYGIQ